MQRWRELGGTVGLSEWEIKMSTQDLHPSLSVDRQATTEKDVAVPGEVKAVEETVA